MKNFLKYLLSYIKGNILIILSYIFLILMYDFMFLVFNLPTNIMLYSTVIILFIITVISVIKLSSNYKKYKELIYIRNQLENNSVDLPSSNKPYEQVLIEIIDELKRSRSDIIYEKDNVISDMNLYYSIWAHQIKTPIAAMNLQIQTENLPQYKDLNYQLFKIEEYVEMALNYIRAESMSGDLVIEIYELDKIIKRVVKKYSKAFIRKKIALDYENLNVKVLTDQKWLTFVMEQIISNALKYTKEGKISIYMENDYTLVIEDTGIGISLTDLPRLFEKGYTGYTGREYTKSTGIGLYLCQKILNKLSHSISVESQLDVGTKVKIEFIK